MLKVGDRVALKSDPTLKGAVGTMYTNRAGKPRVGVDWDSADDTVMGYAPEDLIEPATVAEKRAEIIAWLRTLGVAPDAAERAVDDLLMHAWEQGKHDYWRYRHLPTMNPYPTNPYLPKEQN